MRIQIPIVIEMTDDQVETYADKYALPRNGAGKVMAKDIVEEVRSYVLTLVQECAPFGVTQGTRGADVSIKR